MRVALVAHGIHFRGGMERCFAELARALCREQEVHLFASEVADVPLDSVIVHAVPVRHKPVAAKFLQFYARSTQMLQRETFDIVHTIGGITARQNIVTAQYCQHAWGQAIAQVPGAAEGVTPYHRMMWRLTGFFEKRAVNSPQTRIVSANSCRTGADLVRFYGTNPAKVHVVYNGVDAERFTPENARFRGGVRRQYGISGTDFLLLFAGEYRRKGLANVIRALGRLRLPVVHLLAVGAGDQTHYQAVAAQAGVSAQVTLAGPAANIEHLFGAADAFVFPTLYEPFGMVITEAMASGLPVITSRRAGASEMIENGITGFLLDNPGDAGEIAEKIQEVVSLGPQRREIGCRARQSVSGHGWEAVAVQTLKLYGQVMGAPK